MNNQNNRSNVLWIVAGLYLLYLAWSLGKGVMQGESTGTALIVSVIAGVVFAAAGAVLLIKAFRSMFSASGELPEEAEETENAGTAEGTEIVEAAGEDTGDMTAEPDADAAE